MSSAEYKSIEHEFLVWIESRLKTGVALTRMNEELKAAGLLDEEPKDPDDVFDSAYVGFLGEIEIKPPMVDKDLLGVRFGFHTGSFCNFDDTLVLYKRNPLRQVAQINAQQGYTHGYRLREFTAGSDDPGIGSMIGSLWVASNCTSNWNGEILRIDLAHRSLVKNVLEQGVSAFLVDPATIVVEDDTVTFRYQTSVHDFTVLNRGAVARYRVRNGSAVREAPIAPSFGGFIDEWLNLNDSEAARWSTPDAALHHHDLAARLKNESLEWKHVAACPGSPPTREIAIQWSESKQTTVFQIGGSNTKELRMLSVSGDRSPGCREIDISGNLTSIFGEPPQ